MTFLGGKISGEYLNIGMKVLNEAGKTPKLPLGKSLREDVHLA